MDTMPLILTSKVGKFTFDAGVPLSLAKRVRDDVTGQMLNPKMRQMRINTEQDAYNHIRAYESDLIARIGFELELGEGFKLAKLENALREMASATRITGAQITKLANEFNKTKAEIWRLLAREKALTNVA